MSRSPSSRFIALPVGQGDAFFLETPGRTLLVDGGRSIDCFADLFRNITGRSSVDFVICTHNDADHANGIIGFLQRGCICGEIWLPARWLATLPHVLKPWPEILDSFRQPVLDAQGDFEELGRRAWESGTPLIELYGDQLSREGRFKLETDGTDSTREVDGWPAGLISELEKADEDQPPGVVWVANHAVIRLWPFFNGKPATQLFLEALGAARRIREIALAAFHGGVAVRWFVFSDKAAPSDGLEWLEPANARQTVQVKPAAPEEAVAWLALSTSNRESLVFWAVKEGRCPRVLFTADSDLRGVRLPPALDAFMVTAPHHGSEANSNAYQEVKRMHGGSNVTWVRSDGRYRSRPGQSYLNAPRSRACTLCRTQPPSSKQAVAFFARSRKWTRSRTTKRCSCADTFSEAEQART